MTKKEQLYEGKAKKVFKTDSPELLIVSYKDDATAFNGLKKGTIGKNKYGNQPIPASKIALFLSLFLCIPFLISLWHLTKVIIIYFKGA